MRSLAALALISSLLATRAADPLPVITLPVRVHLVRSTETPAMHTTLVEGDVRRIFEKVNHIWAQASIRFEIESIGPTEAVPLPEPLLHGSEFVRVKAMIPKARLSTDAIDVCYVKHVRPNGFYYGEPIIVKDTASLRPVEGGLDEPIPRVTAHEIGHLLGLQHRQEVLNLMASGNTGYTLNAAEIATARSHAEARLAGKPSPTETAAEPR